MHGVGIVFAVLVCGVLLVAVAGGVQNKRRNDALLAYAAQTGWATVDPATVPEQFAGVIRWRRPRLVLVRRDDRGDVWMVWHHWTTSQQNGRTTTTRHHDRTTYAIELSRAVVAAAVVRRTAIGAWIVPVRGIGTGDSDFDAAYLVKPSDDPSAVALVGPRMRAALMAGQVQPWQLSNGVVSVSFDRPPRAETIAAGAAAAEAVASLVGQ